MPYKLHSRVSIIGTWADYPAEIWECSVALSGNGPDGTPVANLQGYVDSVATPVSNWFHNNGHIPGTAQMTMLKIANIGPDGKYAGDPAMHDYSPVISGTGSVAAPGFVSFVYTWKTIQRRPPGAYGRIYPPNNGIGMSTSFEISTAAAQQEANSANALLLALTLTGSNTAIPVVASKVGEGSNNAILTASVDTVADVQRRRKNRVKGVRFVGE